MREIEQFGANSIQQSHGRTDAVQTPKRTCLSTTDIVESSEISPPEKKRRILETGAVLTSALKAVAYAHNKNIFTALGTVASQDERSEISNILSCSTDIIFAKLGPKKGLNIVLSGQYRSKLMASICVADWMNLLLKVRLTISDEG